MLSEIELYIIGVVFLQEEGQPEGEGKYKAYLMDDDTTSATGITPYEALRELVAQMESEDYYNP